MSVFLLHAHIWKSIQISIFFPKITSLTYNCEQLKKKTCKQLSQNTLMFHKALLAIFFSKYCKSLCLCFHYRKPHSLLNSVDLLSDALLFHPLDLFFTWLSSQLFNMRSNNLWKRLFLMFSMQNLFSKCNQQHSCGFFICFILVFLNYFPPLFLIWLQGIIRSVNPQLLTPLPPACAMGNPDIEYSSEKTPSSEQDINGKNWSACQVLCC